MVVDLMVYFCEQTHGLCWHFVCT